MKSSGFAMIAACLFFLINVSAWSESVYGNLVHTENIDIPETSRFSIHLEELASLSLLDTYGLIEAVELEIGIPEIIAESRNSFALYVYNNCTPDPSLDEKTYRCNLPFMDILPSGNTLFYHLPVTTDYSKRTSFNTIVADTQFPAAGFPILLTIMPVMKGIPDGVYSVTFDIHVRPIVKNRGIVELIIETEDGPVAEEDLSSLEVFLDNAIISNISDPFSLKPGIHSVHVTSPDFVEKTRSFILDKGEIKKVTLTLEKLAPKVIFEAPENAKTFLDGERFDYIPGESIQLSEGEHTVLFQLGDYSLSKKFRVEKGKSYTVSLSLDIIVKER